MGRKNGNVKPDRRIGMSPSLRRIKRKKQKALRGRLHGKKAAA